MHERVTRVFVDHDGETHFEELALPLHDRGAIGMLSDPLAASAVQFRYTGGDYDYGRHNAPREQLVVMLEGGVEIETSDGERRRFEAGDILWLQDVHGKGHRSRALDGRPRRSLFIPLSENEAIGNHERTPDAGSPPSPRHLG